MASIDTPAFKFDIDGTTTELIAISGKESLNQLFEYTLTISPVQASSSQSKSIKALLDRNATLSILKQPSSLYDSDLTIFGYIAAVAKQGLYWQVTLRPSIHKKCANTRSEIYFSESADLTADQIIQRELSDDLDLKNNSFKQWSRGNEITDFNPELPGQRLFCQYKESNFNFMARLCDHWGIYFYFDHFEDTFVFSNNKEYDQRIENTFSVVEQGNADTITELSDWQESYVEKKIFTTIHGYNNQTAGSIIESSYPLPTDDAIEQKIHLDDVESPEAAEYLAQIFHEREAAMFHQAQCSSHCALLFPGFLISTDEEDFSSALITSSRWQADKLEPNADGSYSGNFKNHLSLIPGDVQYRAQLTHPIPKASGATGRIYSDTDEQTVALRSDHGEYKVELIGFDNESGIHPWVRKAQTTAGANNHDFPLLPDIEVRIAFLGNNPNCPIIEYALENSQHPAPVTNENPHQAIIATQGTLVTKSDLGRFNLTHTSEYPQPVEDAAIPTSIVAANYFDHSTEQDNHDFLKKQETSGDFILSRTHGDSISLTEGDSFIAQKGRVFQSMQHQSFHFGGQYHENMKASQASDVSSQQTNNVGDHNFDLFQRPNNNQVSTLSASVLEQEGYEQSDLLPPDYPTSSEDVKINKTFIDQYNFQTGSIINVKDKLNSLDITHSDDDTQNIEVEYKNNVLRRFSDGDIEKKWDSDGELVFECDESEDGVSDTTEWFENTGKKKSHEIETENDSSITTESTTYNVSNGDPVAYSKSTTDGAGTSEFSMQYAPSATASLSFAPSTEFSMASEPSASLAISMSASVSIEIGANASLEIKTGAEISLELDFRTGLSGEIGNDGVEFEGIGFRARAEAKVDAQKKMLAMSEVQAVLSSKNLGLEQTQIDMMTKNLAIANGVEIKL